MGLTDTTGVTMQCPDRGGNSGNDNITSSVKDTGGDEENLESQRNVCTSILYMLTKEENIGYWHMNKSDIVHYHQGGCTLTYLMIDPQTGVLSKQTVGQNVEKGDVPQLIVKGGIWKATVLLEKDNEGMIPSTCDWGLIGEAVAPGFDYRDMQFGTEEKLQQFVDIWEDIKPYIKQK